MPPLPVQDAQPQPGAEQWQYVQRMYLAAERAAQRELMERLDRLAPNWHIPDPPVICLCH